MNWQIVLAVFIGFVFGILTNAVLTILRYSFGVLQIDQSDVDNIRYRFVFNRDIDEVLKLSFIIFAINKRASLPKTSQD